MLRHDLRLELAFAIAGYLDLDFPKVALQFLSALSIPGITAAAAFGTGSSRSPNDGSARPLALVPTNAFVSCFKRPVLSDQVFRFLVSLQQFVD